MPPPQRKQRVTSAEAEAPSAEAAFDEESLGAIPDLVRRAVAMGLTGFFSTEKGEPRPMKKPDLASRS